MSMTDQEAIARAQKELNTSSYIAETGSTAGLRTMHQNRVRWLLRVLRLAKIALREQEERRWIPVTERLPKQGTVLVTDGNIVITAPSSSVTADGQAITHWMPMPQPPRGCV